MQIKVNNREIKDVGHFKYLGSVLIRYGYCTKEIKMRIVIAPPKKKHLIEKYHSARTQEDIV